MSYPLTLGYYSDWNMDGILNILTKGKDTGGRVWEMWSLNTLHISSSENSGGRDVWGESPVPANPAGAVLQGAAGGPEEQKQIANAVWHSCIYSGEAQAFDLNPVASCMQEEIEAGQNFLGKYIIQWGLNMAYM